METAIIIVNYRTPWYLNKCLESVFAHSTKFHIFLVQNRPDRRSRMIAKRYLATHPDQLTEIVNTKNEGFVSGVNSAFSQAMEYERVCFLNSDVIVTDGWLKYLNEALDDESVAQVSPDANNFHKQGFFWRAVSKLPFGLGKFHYRELKTNPPRSKDILRGFKEVNHFYEFPGGFCNLTRTKYFKDLGYFFDPNIIHGYWDDFDTSLYLRQFGKVGSTNRAYVYHFLNVSLNKVSGRKSELKSRLMLLNGLYVMKKWKDYLVKNLQKYSREELLVSEGSYVVKMILTYLGLESVDANLNEYIESIPAKEVGKQFLE